MWTGQKNQTGLLYKKIKEVSQICAKKNSANGPVVLQPAYRYHTTTAKPQCNTNTHQTRAIQPMK